MIPCEVRTLFPQIKNKFKKKWRIQILKSHKTSNEQFIVVHYIVVLSVLLNAGRKKIKKIMDIILNIFVALHVIVFCAFGTCICGSMNFWVLFPRLWVILQQLNMKRKGFNILPHLKEEMICTNTIRRNVELFWR